MKRVWVNTSLVLSLLGVFVSCNGNSRKEATAASDKSAGTVEAVTVAEVKDKTFAELFQSIPETEIGESVFKLVGKDFTVITAGDSSHYNSMVASWGGWGILFEKPATWCFLRSNRYTLELIRKHHTYTMSYFDDPFKEQIILFGMKSGRDSDKMKESALTPVQTPSGNMTYKEAKLVIECTLVELTTVSPDDFLTPSGRDFIVEAHKETNEYHKLVFGEITGIWAVK
jgi:flavin reductase (DIM6/NTAB) family NADH-FMN oxidoreductase RutF